METKAKDEALARTLSTGQGITTAGRNDCKEISPQLNATEQARDASARRYEQLTAAVKAFIFTVIVKDGHAVCTIHYPGVCRITGYTEEEYAAQPLLWFTMIYPEDKDIVLQQIARLLRGETPPPIKHRILHKNGSIRWFRNTSVPVFDSKGKLIAYDGLVVDISEIEFAEVKQEHQIAELTSALAMVKTLHSLLPICCSCKKIRDDKGYWQQIEAYIEVHYSAITFTHGLCPSCAKRLYPQYFEDIPETALVTKLVADIQEVTSVVTDKTIEAAVTKHQALITAGRGPGHRC
jgi:PAS domain S-box-containing protein